MLTTILTWLGGKLAGPIAFGCALLLAAALAWQTARIDGLPLIGGGLKAQVAGLTQQLAARDLAQARGEAAALQARAQLATAQEAIAAKAATSDQAIQTQIQTVIREVPRAVPTSRACAYLPWGAVRLLDAAASGADVGDVAARIAPGQPDDAASDVKLSEAVALLAADLGVARQNAGQLEGLEHAVHARSAIADKINGADRGRGAGILAKN
jgi:hypothetical protein